MKNQKKNWRIYIVSILLLSVVLFPFVQSATFVTDTQADFSEGTYLYTTFNETTQAVVLKQSSDALPDNSIDCSAVNGVNMTDNIFMFHVDNVGSTIVDTSGNNYNGTTMLSYENSTGFINESIKINGNGRVEITDVPQLNGSITISLWVKYTGTTWQTWSDLVTRFSGNYNEQPHEFVVGVDDGGTLYWTLGRSDIEEGIYTQWYGPSNNTWYHILGVYDADNNNLSLYVDGDLKDYTAVSYPVIKRNKTIILGKDPNDDETNDLLKMDEIALFNRAFSMAEVQNLYQWQIGNHRSKGIYTSEIFNAGSSATWDNISWWRTHGWELPNYKTNEDYITNPANMTDNILLMHLNEDSGTIIDYSGEENNGSYNGLLHNQSGMFGASIGFNGTTDVINCSNDTSLNPTTNISISAWIRVTLPATEQAIVSKISLPSWNGYNYVVGMLGNTGIWWGTTDHWGNITVDDGIWHFVTATYNGTISSLYVDGVLDSTQSSINGLNNPDGNLWIGQDHSASRPFNGNIDELAIWNRTLSPTEVLNHYKRGILRLNLSVRSSDNPTCSGATWSSTYTSSPVNLSLIGYQYFQYKFNFETETPELYNVTVDYTQSLNVSNPYPSNNSIEISRPPTNLSVYITGDEIDVYVTFRNNTPFGGVWTPIQTFNNVNSGRIDIINLDTFGINTEFIWGNTTYNWWVNATDGNIWVNKSYYYTTVSLVGGGRNARYDVNNDGNVDVFDLSAIWGHRTVAGYASYNGIYNTNNDGNVDVFDLSVIWGSI